MEGLKSYDHFECAISRLLALTRAPTTHCTNVRSSLHLPVHALQLQTCNVARN